jgi:hypothetical protein
MIANYNHEGWTVVRLTEYFIRHGMESNQARVVLNEKVRPWCESYALFDGWELSGVTKFSYRIQFKDSRDALCFKLAFNI